MWLQKYGATFLGGIMYEHPFTIKEVAWLLSIRCLDGGTAQEFPVECPYCGDTRGKCSFCVSKNGEMKNMPTVVAIMKFLQVLD